MQPSPPVALTIAGSDCSSGAGIQADLKTFEHFGVHGLTAITCVVSETANVVRAVHPVPPEIAGDQVALLLESFPVAAMKTGMLFSAAHIAAVLKGIEASPSVPLVVDPVMIASTGDSLLEADAVDAIREHLLPRATLVTPNLPEAASLLGASIGSLDELKGAALQLSERFGVPFLVKGGHLEGPECIDLLAEGGQIHDFTSPRIPLEGSHGTGCTFSAAITANLALGHPLREAIARAKDYLNRTLAESYVFTSRDGITVHALNQGTTFKE